MRRDESMLSPRGVETCRACEASDLRSVLDLGLQPLANELLPSAASDDAVFPLHLRICSVCGLGQVGEVVSRERIFADYPYLSSVSSSWVQHARLYAQSTTRSMELDASTLVVEVASNDGYLLREFQALGVPVLGIEPAGNVAELAREAGTPTTTAFFGRSTAQQIVKEEGHPRLVVANNVMAHVPDLDDFVGGLAEICGPDTVISVENPSFATLLRETQFDTIYHEHFSYLSAHAVARLVARHGLDLFRVEDLPTHGGSYRYWIAPRGRRNLEPIVSTVVARELAGGLLSSDVWTDFAQRSRQTVEGLRQWLHEQSRKGSRVAAYGAAAKGNTLLNAARVTADDLSAVADGSHEKQGKLLPGSRVPVVAPAALSGIDPTDVLILPWNIAAELVDVLSRLVPDARLWTAVPAMRRLA